MSKKLKLPRSPQDYFAIANALIESGQEGEGVVVAIIAAAKIAGKVAELAKICGKFSNSLEKELSEFDRKLQAKDPEYREHAARVDRDLEESK